MNTEVSLSSKSLEAICAQGQILVADDDVAIQRVVATQLKTAGYPCRIVSSVEEALSLIESGFSPAAALLDINMPGQSGLELVQELIQRVPYLQVVMMSGIREIAVVRDALHRGAYDYLQKPFAFSDLRNTIKRALETRSLKIQNERYHRSLEAMVLEQTHELRETRDIAMLTLAKLAESRDTGSMDHLHRISSYSGCLARAWMKLNPTEKCDSSFVEQLIKSSPLHDIGKVGIPDSILLKTGPLSSEEWQVMRTHPTLGGNTLKSVLDQFEKHSFMVMAMEIAYSHHEKWDGSGYPQGLSGEAIPLASRIVSLADAYDAITSIRPYKDAFSHEEAVRRIQADGGAHFDPRIVDIFLEIHEQFDEIRCQRNESE